MVRTIADPSALAELERRLLALDVDSGRRWGTLSPGEMLCHLGDATASVLASSGGSRIRSRPLLKWIALRTPIRWPKGRPTLASVDPRREGTKPSDFEADRRRVIDGLRDVAARRPEQLPVGHSIFGAMTASDWWVWAYRHTDHHLRQFGV